MKNHPFCSTDDMAPNDNHLLLNSKKHVRRQRFLADDELKYATKQRLKGKSEMFYFTGTEKLLDRYRLCIECDHDVEK